MQDNLNNDNALNRIVTSAISSSAEELISIIINKIHNNVSKRLTFGQKIDYLKSNTQFPEGFDLEFLENFNRFVLYLRNSTTHKSGQLNDVEKFKSDLAVNIMFPYLDFYTKIVYPTLIGEESSLKIKPIDKHILEELVVDSTYYYAIDGDNTGQVLENLFVTDIDVNSIKQKSKSIKEAMTTIISNIKTIIGKDAIIFEAGDDILFKGYCSLENLKEFQNIYEEKTKGLTCSIGVGDSLLDVFFALKLAKAQPNKKSIKIVATKI